MRHTFSGPSEINLALNTNAALLDLEQFSDSPYAAELRRDFPRLRFSAALEKKDFSDVPPGAGALARALFQLATFLLCLAVALRLIVLDGVPARSVLTGWLGLAVPVTLFLLWASWSSFYERIYVPSSRSLCRYWVSFRPWASPRACSPVTRTRFTF